MTPTIHELDATTVDQIAAGEVVERPASAVKELVENAVDADAARIDVAVSAGGKAGIRVADDGHGMTAGELHMAVQEHTTSKIDDVGDLQAGIRTLGFRGEALYAIGAVSRLTIRSRPRGGERGTELVVEGGEIQAVGPAGCPEGTVVEVADLFSTVPARREYLGTDATEFDHVNRVVAGYALANPDVAVSLTHDRRETFATPGRGDRRDAVMAVYGRDVASAMVPVAADGSDLPAGPVSGVNGLVSHPETTRSTRDYLTTLVNGRYVTAGSVREAVVDAYGRQLAADRFPFAVIDVAVPGDAVDVNVHPRKLEVRFSDPSAVRAQVEAAVEEALLEAGLIRSSAPRGRSAPEQTAISPDRPDVPPDGRAPAGDGARAGSTPTDGRGASQSDRGPAESGQEGRAHPPGEAGFTRPGPRAIGEKTDPDRTGSDRARGSDDHHVDPHERARSAADRFRLASTQATLDEEPLVMDQAFDRLPSMRILGQLRGTYIVAETADGMVLIDQHAADERVNYERLHERFADDVATQALAEPVEMDLTAGESALFDAHREALTHLGFHATAVDGRTVEVDAVPSVVADAAEPSLLRDVLAGFVGGDPAETVEETADRLLADLSCYPAVTANTSLREGTVLDLLEALDGCENPYACPHGRPVLIELPDEEIADRFERDYPGHGGRRPE